MNAFETALSAFGSKVVPFISTNFLLVVAASLATVVSIVAAFQTRIAKLHHPGICGNYRLLFRDSGFKGLAL